MITGLGSRVDAYFSEDAKFLYVKAPYNAEFNWALGANQMWSEWIPEGRVRKFKAEDYDDVMKLLYDYYNLEEVSQCSTDA